MQIHTESSKAINYHQWLHNKLVRGDVTLEKWINTVKSISRVYGKVKKKVLLAGASVMTLEWRTRYVNVSQNADSNKTTSNSRAKNSIPYSLSFLWVQSAQCRIYVALSIINVLEAWDEPATHTMNFRKWSEKEYSRVTCILISNDVLVWIFVILIGSKKLKLSSPHYIRQVRNDYNLNLRNPTKAQTYECCSIFSFSAAASCPASNLAAQRRIFLLNVSASDIQ